LSSFGFELFDPRGQRRLANQTPPAETEVGDSGQPGDSAVQQLAEMAGAAPYDKGTFPRGQDIRKQIKTGMVDHARRLRRREFPPNFRQGQQADLFLVCF
jgi:hypothetical protein